MPTLTGSHKNISIVIPAKNESQNLERLLPRVMAQYADAEIIVVDDASTDETARICERFPATLIRHPYSLGNGAAIKSGFRRATGEIVVFIDGDGQHDPADIEKLLALLEQGFDMAVGARTADSHTSLWRRVANATYNRLASWMVNRTIPDLTSGLRAAQASKFREFLHLLPNGFSYPTTITMSFFRAGYTVGFVEIVAHKRVGKSHINALRDGVRFFLIIFKIGTLYSPLKLFLPFSLFFFLTGVGYYAYTFLMYDRFTNMSALLLSVSILIFLIGLVSEQITMLLYSRRGE
ncbi:MAG: glycosyltransferase family 2 protein [Sulfuricaulis sp.]